MTNITTEYVLDNLNNSSNPTETLAALLKTYIENNPDSFKVIAEVVDYFNRKATYLELIRLSKKYNSSNHNLTDIEKEAKSLIYDTLVTNLNIDRVQWAAESGNLYYINKLIINK